MSMSMEQKNEVKWGDWIGEGWNMFAENWKVWVLQMLVLFLVIAVPIIPIYGVVIAAQLATIKTGAPPEPPGYFVPLLATVVPLLVALVIFLWCGIWKTAFKQLRGEPTGVADLFTGGDIFLRLLGAIILMGVIVSVCAIFCFFPGLIAAGLLFFTVPLIVGGNMGVVDAMSASFRATKGNWLMFALFAFVVALLAAAGQLACYIGLLATYPLQFTIAAVAYRDVFRIQGARSFSSKPASSQTSYSGQQWPVGQGYNPPPPARIAEPQPQQVTRCTQCGASLTNAVNFCIQCGARLR